VKRRLQAVLAGYGWLQGNMRHHARRCFGRYCGPADPADPAAIGRALRLKKRSVSDKNKVCKLFEAVSRKKKAGFRRLRAVSAGSPDPFLPALVRQAQPAVRPPGPGRRGTATGRIRRRRFPGSHFAAGRKSASPIRPFRCGDYPAAPHRVAAIRVYLK